jgi:hypothetical protein
LNLIANFSDACAGREFRAEVQAGRRKRYVDRVEIFIVVKLDFLVLRVALQESTTQRFGIGEGAESAGVVSRPRGVRMAVDDCNDVLDFASQSTGVGRNVKN